MLAWLKEHGANPADPYNLIDNEDDKHKRNIAQKEHSLV